MTSLANYLEKYIFLIGGCSREEESVDVYNIEDSSWKSAPSLNEDRNIASSCVLGDSVYTFGGCSLLWPYPEVNSIETISAKQVIQDAPDLSWKLIKLSEQTLKPRQKALFYPISSTELVIFGGNAF